MTLTVLVTGANSGIGQATAEALVAQGARVILAARSEARTRPVLETLRRRYRAAEVSFLPLDLADLASVRRSVGTFLNSGSSLDVLVNNAGLAARGTTADGFDITVGTNHIGPFLLTHLLLPRLEEAAQGRIVNVSSVAHTMVRRIDWGIMGRPPRGHKGFAAYGVSKLFNVLHAKELTRRLASTRVTTYALHPGAVASNIWRGLPGPLQWIMKKFMITNEQGARTSVYCATDSALRTTSGGYFVRCREVTPSPLALDEGVARELFARSEAAVSPYGAPL
ncbi:MAG: SDR family oxidoreductase [Gemmatimonadaceae bacterium]